MRGTLEAETGNVRYAGSTGEWQVCVTMEDAATDALPGCVAAIHPQVCPCHIRACVAEQEYRCPTILLGLAKLPQHVLRGPIGPPLGVELEELIHHGGHDVSRGNGVDADAVLAPFGREIARELDDASFGGIICRADESLGEA